MHESMRSESAFHAGVRTGVGGADGGEAWTVIQCGAGGIQADRVQAPGLPCASCVTMNTATSSSLGFFSGHK